MMSVDDASSAASAPPRTPSSTKEVLNWADDYSSNEEEWVPEAPCCCARAAGSDELAEPVWCGGQEAEECCELPFCMAVEVDLEKGAPPMGVVGRTYCEGPHSFKSFKARDGHYQCGGCRCPIPTGTEMLGCTNCTFDICLKCMDDYVVNPPAAEEPAPSAPPAPSANPLMNMPLPVCSIQLSAPSHIVPDFAIHPAPEIHLRPPTSYGHRRRPRKLSAAPRTPLLLPFG